MLGLEELSILIFSSPIGVISDRCLKTPGQSNKT